MAYQLIRELIQTLRESPMRAAAACVLLITTTVYVCTGHDDYRVAEIGEAAAGNGTIDLASLESWDDEAEYSPVSEETDAPATTRRVDGRDQYIDARLTHAVSEEEEPSENKLTRVTPVSGVAVRRTAPEAPVWLLGVLIEE